jgi:hypothetical protein
VLELGSPWSLSHDHGEPGGEEGGESTWTKSGVRGRHCMFSWYNIHAEHRPLKYTIYIPQDPGQTTYR